MGLEGLVYNVTRWREGRWKSRGLMIDGYHYSWMRLFEVLT